MRIAITALVLFGVLAGTPARAQDAERMRDERRKRGDKI